MLYSLNKMSMKVEKRKGKDLIIAEENLWMKDTGWNAKFLKISSHHGRGFAARRMYGRRS